MEPGSNETKASQRRSIESLKTTEQTVIDAQDLAALGHEEELSRKFNIWSILSFAFCVLATWSTFAQDLASGLSNGGPITIIWGLFLVAACNLCVAVSLGELCSSMPTALGQAYWVHRLWNTPAGRFTSYLCAWISCFGWWTLTASCIAFLSNFLLGMKVMFDVEWDGINKGWLLFLVYLGVALCFTIFNVVACRKDYVLPWFNNFMGIGFFALFFIFSLALLISTGTKAELNFQSGTFVFGRWINETSWGDGVTFFMGLVQAAYGLTAFDAVIHMAEEIPAPRKNVPKAIWVTIVCSFLSGLVFMIVCLFCIQDVDLVINTPTDLPFMQLMEDTVGLQGSAVLISLFLSNLLGQGVGCMTTSSRLTWGFARDGGLPFSKYFSYVDPYWKVPVRAIWLQAALIALVAVLYLFANTVLEAILSVSTIALTVSYAMPIAALLIVGRERLPPRAFSLGRMGVPINVVSIIYCVTTTIFFFFPYSPTPSGSDMNYAIAIFGIMLVVATGFWLVQGRRTYLNTEGGLQRIIEARRMEAAHEPLPSI